MNFYADDAPVLSVSPKPLERFLASIRLCLGCVLAVSPLHLVVSCKVSAGTSKKP